MGAYWGADREVSKYCSAVSTGAATSGHRYLGDENYSSDLSAAISISNSLVIPRLVSAPDGTLIPVTIDRVNSYVSTSLSTANVSEGTGDNQVQTGVTETADLGWVVVYSANTPWAYGPAYDMIERYDPSKSGDWGLQDFMSHLEKTSIFRHILDNMSTTGPGRPGLRSGLAMGDAAVDQDGAPPDGSDAAMALDPIASPSATPETARATWVDLDRLAAQLISAMAQTGISDLSPPHFERSRSEPGGLLAVATLLPLTP